MRSPHEVLNIGPDATPDEIEAAYRRLRLYSDPANAEYRDALDAARDALLRGCASEKEPVPTPATVPPPSAPAPQPTRPPHPGFNRLQTAMIACILLLVASAEGYAIWYLHGAQTRKTQATAVQAVPSEGSGVAAVAQKILPSTVLIDVECANGDFAYGSGFFVNGRGDVLTNYHVVEDASSINITTNDKTTYPAKVRAYDERADMALLSSEVLFSDSLPLVIAEALPAVGEAVVAAGSPRKQFQSVSNGIVAGIREADGITAIQITAPISPGSSGGPVVNMKGQVLGISTAIRTDAQNINFAVSSKHLASFVAYAENMPPLPLAAKRPPPPQRTARVTPPARPAPQDERTARIIPLPDEYGFMGHKWECSVEELQARLPNLRKAKLNLLDSEHSEDHSTYTAFKAFNCRADTLVYYSFYNNLLTGITFIVYDRYGTGDIDRKFLSISAELTMKYGRPKAVPPMGESWLNGDIIILLETPNKNAKSFLVNFLDAPLFSEITEEPTQEPVQYGRVDVDAAACRERPSLDSQVSGWSQKGTIVAIHEETYAEEDGRTWYYVSYQSGGTTYAGWMLGTLIDVF